MSKTREAKPKSPSSAPREKALKHLRNLLVAGAATQLGAACECGPVVCDPLPPPLECSNNPTTAQYGNSLSWNASALASGNVSVRLEIFDNREKFAFAGDPAVSRATLAGAVSRTASLLSFELTPDAGATDVELVVPVACSGTADSLKYRLVLAGPRLESME